MKVWRLINPDKRREFQEKLCERISEVKGDLMIYRSLHIEVAKEVCGKTTGKRQKEEETWWWCEEVKQAIEEKRKTFNEWQTDRTEESRRLNKKTKQVKRAVVAAKNSMAGVV